MRQAAMQPFSTQFSNFKTSPQAQRIPFRTGGLVVTSLLLFALFGAAPPELVYNRSLIQSGELWRLITGHFVHCDIEHLLWNTGALLILGSIVERLLGKHIISLTVISCLGVSGWLWFCKVDLLLYCGLSGTLNGLLAVALIMLWLKQRSPILPIVATISVAKIIIESIGQQSLFTNISWASVPGAHGAGMVTGFLYVLILAVITKKSATI